MQWSPKNIGDLPSCVDSMEKSAIHHRVTHILAEIYSFGGSNFLFDNDDRAADGCGSGTVTVGCVGSCLLVVDVSTVLLRLPVKHSAS